MQPLVNASKAQQAIPAGALKTTQKQVKSSNRSWRAKE